VHESVYQKVALIAQEAGARLVASIINKQRWWDDRLLSEATLDEGTLLR